MTKKVDAAAVRRMLDDGAELALLDVREEGVFSRDGHVLLASNVPLSQLELLAPTLVPRAPTRIVLCDGGDGIAALAAERLAQGGYTNVHVLTGGTPAWQAAGGRLYTGVYVPSKAFGEYVFHHDAPAEVTAQELAEWKAQGMDLLLLDSRPLDEYRLRTLPGAIDCPGAELTYRTKDLVKSPQTRIVVNCGGRTRSIIGAQALINAGIGNSVYAFKDGTQGWHLAGFEVARGCTAQAPLPSPDGRAWAADAARRLETRFGVRRMDRPRLAALQSDPARTVYLLDVRSPEEYELGHLADSVHAPGGQIVQATDCFLAVRNATVVLADNDGVRATATAAWLLQMGWRDVFVLDGAFDGAVLVSGPRTAPVMATGEALPETVTPAELQRLIGSGEAQVVDLDTTLVYREAHIPGAWHAVRSRFAQNLLRVPRAAQLVLTSRDGVLARVAATDAARCVATPVRVLDGGTAAWRAAGLPLEAGESRLTGAADDVRYRAFDHKANPENAMREYLKWEVDLQAATASDADFGFRRFA